MWMNMTATLSILQKRTEKREGRREGAWREEIDSKKVTFGADVSSALGRMRAW